MRSSSRKSRHKEKGSSHAFVLCSDNKKFFKTSVPRYYVLLFNFKAYILLLYKLTLKELPSRS